MTLQLEGRGSAQGCYTRKPQGLAMISNRTCAGSKKEVGGMKTSKSLEDLVKGLETHSAFRQIGNTANTLGGYQCRKGGQRGDENGGEHCDRLLEELYNALSRCERLA